MEMHDMQAPHNKLEAQLPGESPQGNPSSPPPAAVEMVQRWNHPKSNVPKVGACFWSFVVMGANDAAYGVSSSLAKCALVSSQTCLLGNND